MAAWDAPGMDFLSEEQTLKYLNRSNSIEVGTLKSPSVATTAELVDEAPSPSGSLPECEQGGRLTMIRVHQSGMPGAETNFENPAYSSSRHNSELANFENPTYSRHSSESTKDDSDDTEIVTKSSNIL